MIQRFQFGQMLPTESVVLSLPVTGSPVPFLTPDGTGWRYDMAPEDVIYGLGEMVRGMNKRGWHYCANNSDEPHHTEDKQSLYGAHNFLLVSGGTGRPTFGVFIDFAGPVEYDIGYTDEEILTFRTSEPDYDLYLITGEGPADICRELRRLTGRSYIPPKWAFGLAQSRWGYQCEADIRAVAQGYRENNLPLDMICMDIDYMANFADFTVNQERFPDLAGLAAGMKSQGIHLVPIIDAGIRADDKDETCREGLERDYFCKKEDGTPFVAAVWPGEAYFADFLRPEVRSWFGGRYRALTELGIDGFWNDMNEPALFYTPDRLKAAVQRAAELGAKGNLDMYAFSELQQLINGLSNNPDDYRSFYHLVDGQPVRHDRIHNLYGGNMTRAAGEALQALRPDRRTLLYSRSSFIGSHRYGGIWLGDNDSSWAQLRENIHQMASVQMCGFLYTGADLGGFGGDTTPDLVMRWLEFGIFTPLMRNHSALGTRNQEYYRFEKWIPSIRNLLNLRMALLPYLYSEFMKAALGDGLYFRPLAFDYPGDAMARQVEDQLLLGEGVMVAPVCTQNAAGRYVYLPEPMKLLRLRSVDDFDTELMPAGHHYIPCALNEVLLFLRPGCLVPVARPACCVAELDETSFTFWSYPVEDSPCTYRMYSDDGVGTDYDRPEHWRTLKAGTGQ